MAAVPLLVVEMAMVELVLGMSMWGPPRMIAAIVRGKGVLPPPETFDAMRLVPVDGIGDVKLYRSVRAGCPAAMQNRTILEL
jgi:hypothetical protein